MVDADGLKRRVKSTTVVGAQVLLAVALVGCLVWALSGFGLFSYKPLLESVGEARHQDEIDKFLRNYPRTRLDNGLAHYSIYKYELPEADVTILYDWKGYVLNRVVSRKE